MQDKTPKDVPEVHRRQSTSKLEDGHRPVEYQLSQEFNPSLGNIYIFVAVLAIMGVLSFFIIKPAYSEFEKRDLSEKPEFSIASYMAGDYAKEADAYYADTFPYREFFVQLGAVIRESRGVRFDDVRIHEGTGVPTTEPVEPPPEDPVDDDSSSSVPTVVDDGAVGEQNGAVFIYKGMGLSMFGGSNAMGEWYARTVNRYADTLENVQVYDLVIPTHIEFVLPERYQSVTMPQKPNIDHIYSNLNDKVKAVDAYSQIQAHMDDYLYFNTDHHWTMRGAYYAYVAFCEQAGFDPVPLDSMELRRIEPFLGTLYGQTQDTKLRDNPDYVEYPVFTTEHTAYRYMPGSPYYGVETTVIAEYATGGNAYSCFLHGDYPLTEIQTGIKNGRKIMVVKESFGNAFAPFLLNHYESVYIVDQRYFQLGAVNFIQEKGINEIIFVNNIFAANTAYHIQCIENMMYQVYVPYVPEPDPEPEPEEPPADPGEEENPGDEAVDALTEEGTDAEPTGGFNRPESGGDDENEEQQWADG